MGKLYTAFNVKQYSELLQKKRLILTPMEDKRYLLEFTEDKSYWITQLKEQKDLENVADYKYSIIIEFEIKADTINSLVESNETGRISQKIANYNEILNKSRTIPDLQENDINVLCVMDVYESDETKDGISQFWSLVVDSEESEIWLRFLEGMYTLSCVGAIPGAVEEAQNLATQ